MNDSGISVDSVKNSAVLESLRNSAVCTLVKVETLTYFVAPVQIAVERKEVG